MPNSLVNLSDSYMMKRYHNPIIFFRFYDLHMVFWWVAKVISASHFLLKPLSLQVTWNATETINQFLLCQFKWILQKQKVWKKILFIRWQKPTSPSTKKTQLQILDNERFTFVLLFLCHLMMCVQWKVSVRLCCSLDNGFTYSVIVASWWECFCLT